MNAKICEHCGKMFYSKSTSRKYCTQACKKEASKIRQLERGQLCWRCKNACGGCSWSKNFTPVEGWDAKPVVLKDEEGEIFTYNIKGCPEFINDR